MLQRILAVAVVAGFCLGDAAVEQASAGVQGKTYKLQVTSSYGTQFQRIFTFKTDGSFSTDGNVSGTYTQTDYGFISFWSANASNGGGFELEYSGVQFLPFMIGEGSNNEGGAFVFFGLFNGPAAAPTRKK
jgi:hypothetical protein